MGNVCKNVVTMDGEHENLDITFGDLRKALQENSQDQVGANAFNDNFEGEPDPDGGGSSGGTGQVGRILIPNTIVLGDCVEFLKSLPDHSIHAVVTSPPYANQRKALYGGIDEADYPAWTVGWMQELKRVLTPDGSVAINIRPHHHEGQISDYTLRMRLALRDDGWREVDELIWDKVGGIPLGSNRLPRRSWESVHWFSLSKRPYCDPKANGSKSDRIGFGKAKGQGLYIGKSGPIRSGIARCIDIVRVPVAACDKSKFNHHPAQYPEELASWLIRLLTPDGGMVYDPFMGSGTTAVAALRSGRQFVGAEMKTEYIDIANRRINALRLTSDAA